MNITVLRKRIRIAREDLEKLEKRFNPDNAIFEYRHHYNWTACPLCEKFPQCFGCPFHKWRKSDEDSEGCMQVLKAFLGDDLAFCPATADINWDVGKDTEARKQLGKIHKIIKNYLNEESC